MKSQADHPCFPPILNSASEAKNSLSENIPHHIRGAAHDCVGGSIGESIGYVIQQGGLWAEDPPCEFGYSLLVFGAEAFGGGGKSRWGLLKNFTSHENPADCEAGLQLGYLLAHK
jgi:hypothetical protein